MASGDTLLIFHPYNNEPPSSNYATLDYRNLHPVLDFDQTTDESAVFSAVMPQHYDGGGVTIYIHWSADGVTANNVIWETAFERIGDQVQDVDSDSFATAQSSGTIAAPGTDGYVDIGSITHTDGAQMDSVAIGELFRLKVTRDATTDTLAADAELHAVEIRET